MATGTASRGVGLLLFWAFCLPAAVSADGAVQLVPTTVSTEPPLLTSDAEHNKLILTAASSADDATHTERPEVIAVSEGSSTRRAKSAAIEALGLNRLPHQNQQLVQSIVDEVSIFRRLPGYRCEVDPKVHEYFVHHPEVAVSIWRAMGISQLQMWPTGEWSYGMDTKDGTTGTINVLYRSRESCLIMCHGMFKSPYLATPISARSVMHLRTTFSQDPSGRLFATHQADMFVALPSQKVETVAKLISPVSNVIIDRNFQEISLFIHVMWLAMGRQPGWVEQIAGDMDGITQERRNELIKLTAEVYVATQAALKRQQGQAVTLNSILPPVQDQATRPISTTQSAADEPAAVNR